MSYGKSYDEIIDTAHSLLEKNLKLLLKGQLSFNTVAEVLNVNEQCMKVIEAYKDNHSKIMKINAAEFKRMNSDF